MAVRIRLQRRGSTKRPFYAVVVADAKMPRDGRFLEKLGTYNPLKESDKLDLLMERYNHWVGVGAIPTATVASLLKRAAAVG
ncbi:30S ribosomal protein S16 [Candidatus Magnetaquicoccus inordinatus]|uniref:30S ribosomal protein S16 n=1 Tax=Candidatus Magnetaquicoccus inordinatus TaxID=2496818 RepID=UPI00102CCB8E|nr:30S ribosomal protein S16 [Candidatus Magnetaquicoccus inordinatus]